MVIAEFVPAIGEQFNAAWKRTFIYKNKYDMKFFTKQSHFEHPIALQCGFYGMHGSSKQNKGIDTENFCSGDINCIGSKDYKTYRQVVNYPKEYSLIFDSAGFQIATYKLKGEEAPITPLQSLRWQEANATEEYDITMNLDVPPSITGLTSYEEFKNALDTSKQNFLFFQNNRKNKKMKLYNVLHGATFEQIDQWYNEVKHFKFDGWAVGVKPTGDPMIHALAIMYLYEKGELKKEKSYGIHIFGTSGKIVVPIFVYIAQKLNIRFTYDSSSYNVGSIYRRYYMPFDFGPHLFFGEKFKLLNPNLKELPCKCPVCSSITDYKELNQPDLYAGALISLHNMYQYIYYNSLLNSLVVNKEHYIGYLQKNIRHSRTLASIEFTDCALEKGVEFAVKKFKGWFTDDITKTKQGDIYGFT